MSTHGKPLQTLVSELRDGVKNDFKWLGLIDGSGPEQFHSFNRVVSVNTRREAVAGTLTELAAVVDQIKESRPVAAAPQQDNSGINNSSSTTSSSNRNTVGRNSKLLTMWKDQARSEQQLNVVQQSLRACMSLAQSLLPTDQVKALSSNLLGPGGPLTSAQVRANEPLVDSVLSIFKSLHLWSEQSEEQPGVVAITAASTEFIIELTISRNGTAETSAPVDLNGHEQVTKFSLLHIRNNGEDDEATTLDHENKGLTQLLEQRQLDQFRLYIIDLLKYEKISKKYNIDFKLIRQCLNEGLLEMCKTSREQQFDKITQGYGLAFQGWDCVKVAYADLAHGGVNELKQLAQQVPVPLVISSQSRHQHPPPSPTLCYYSLSVDTVVDESAPKRRFPLARAVDPEAGTWMRPPADTASSTNTSWTDPVPLQIVIQLDPPVLMTRATLIQCLSAKKETAAQQQHEQHEPSHFRCFDELLFRAPAATNMATSDTGNGTAATSRTNDIDGNNEDADMNPSGNGALCNRKISVVCDLFDQQLLVFQMAQTAVAGIRVSRLPCLESPESILSILSVLRQQILFNRLVDSFLECAVDGVGDQSVAASVELSTEPPSLLKLFVLAPDSQKADVLTVTIAAGSPPTPSVSVSDGSGLLTDQFATDVLQQSMSLPALIVYCLKKKKSKKRNRN